MALMSESTSKELVGSRNSIASLGTPKSESNLAHCIFTNSAPQLCGSHDEKDPASFFDLSYSQSMMEAMQIDEDEPLIKSKSRTSLDHFELQYSNSDSNLASPLPAAARKPGSVADDHIAVQDVTLKQSTSESQLVSPSRFERQSTWSSDGSSIGLRSSSLPVIPCQSRNELEDSFQQANKNLTLTINLLESIRSTCFPPKACDRVEVREKPKAIGVEVRAKPKAIGKSVVKRTLDKFRTETKVIAKKSTKQATPEPPISSRFKIPARLAVQHTAVRKVGTGPSPDLERQDTPRPTRTPRSTKIPAFAQPVPSKSSIGEVTKTCTTQKAKQRKFL